MKGDSSGINRTRGAVSISSFSFLDDLNATALGTKAAAYHVLRIPAHGTATIRLRMYAAGEPTLNSKAFGPEFETIFKTRRHEHDEFYKVPRDSESS